MPLNEQQRAQLDDIVDRMEAAGEPDEEIRFVVEDFTSKYDAPDEDSGIGVGTMVGGAAAVGALALLAKAPGVVGKIGKALNTYRQQAMLSGYALPKSILGGVGAHVERAAETGSTGPLKQLLRVPTLLKDTAKAYKAGGQAYGVTPQVNVHGPGRLIGAFDEAFQNSLQRSGATAKEAEAAMLQKPLPKQLSDALDNPAARYLLPFRRTPFNQFMEGFSRLPGSDYSKAHKGMTAAYSGAGAVHGAATADEAHPVSVPMAIAGSSRQGANYAISALLGRTLAGGSGGSSIASSLVPTSEWGIETSVTDPMRSFRRPAIMTLLGIE
jgi:hypothetical protein